MLRYSWICAIMYNSRVFAWSYISYYVTGVREPLRNDDAINKILERIFNTVSKLCQLRNEYILQEAKFKIEKYYF